MNLLGIVFILGGALSTIAAIFNWDWYMNHPKARFLVALIGRTGARLVYAVMGTAFVVLGVLEALGIFGP
jgi:hypothetical protein